MKRIIGAIVILAVIFGTSIGINHKLNDNIEKMTAVAAANPRQMGCGLTL